MRIVIASSSPRRKELALQMGLEFDIIPSSYKEDMTIDLPPKELAKTLALGKAEDVADRHDGIIIGIDTFLSYNRLLGKPKSEEDAINMLKEISGKTIKAYSGVAIINTETDNRRVECKVTEVKLRKITDDEIKAYMKTGEPYGKAGAIAIQGKGSVFVDEINGSFSNVVGFPQETIYIMLRKMKVGIWKT